MGNEFHIVGAVDEKGCCPHVFVLMQAIQSILLSDEEWRFLVVV